MRRLFISAFAVALCIASGSLFAVAQEIQQPQIDPPAVDLMHRLAEDVQLLLEDDARYFEIFAEQHPGTDAGIYSAALARTLRHQIDAAKEWATQAVVYDVPFVVNDPKAGRDDFQILRSLIIETIRPASWKLTGGVGTISYQAEKSTIIIHNDEAVHRQVSRLLAQLQRADEQAKQAGKQGWLDVIDLKPRHVHFDRGFLRRFDR